MLTAWRDVRAALDGVAGRTKLAFAFALLMLIAALGVVAYDGRISTIEFAVVVAGFVLVVVRQSVVLIRHKKAIARLRSIDDMKSGILYAVSHELRMPLTFIKGASELLASDALSAESRADLHAKVLVSCERLERTVDGLLDVGRLTRGALLAARSVTDIAELLRHVARGLSSDEHPIIVADGHAVASVDAAQVERIAESLFVHAIDHTPSGTKVWASALRIEGGVLITVDDDGPAVPAAVRETIFEAFAQAGNPVDPASATGLGLAVVKRFAEVHGGDAWVEPGAGGGSAFRVFLADAA